MIDDRRLLGNFGKNLPVIAKFAIWIFGTSFHVTTAIAAAVFLTAAAKQKGALTHPFSHPNLY